ncbi:malonate transporter subunit MadL [uncultured Cohaesibacter sp.]|uniref:malonate transporter subunit MadL n=1 Tax=uncultured Cohaesibacter sp. TaxID=1002546 RepID=UPI0029C6FA08|nr:malonate transporter subunit MadL [uncultured Cohaesibacter sp.]
MVIYGLAIMGACMLVGSMLGQGLGYALGVSANVGGVGFAMLFLVLITRRLMDQNKLSKLAESGILFWNAMYIPVVVAMAAKQNVVAAASGGAIAIIAGLVAVFAGFLLIRPLSALADTSASEEAAE